ncbi:hypothetical protein ADUPG1_008575, partial [Aduncisulcus paluster]
MIIKVFFQGIGQDRPAPPVVFPVKDPNSTIEMILPSMFRRIAAFKESDLEKYEFIDSKPGMTSPGKKIASNVSLSELGWKVIGNCIIRPKSAVEKPPIPPTEEIETKNDQITDLSEDETSLEEEEEEKAEDLGPDPKQSQIQLKKSGIIETQRPETPPPVSSHRDKEEEKWKSQKPISKQSSAKTMEVPLLKPQTSQQILAKKKRAEEEKARRNAERLRKIQRQTDITLLSQQITGPTVPAKELLQNSPFHPHHLSLKSFSPNGGSFYPQSDKSLASFMIDRPKYSLSTVHVPRQHLSFPSYPFLPPFLSISSIFHQMGGILTCSENDCGEHIMNLSSLYNSPSFYHSSHFKDTASCPKIDILALCDCRITWNDGHGDCVAFMKSGSPSNPSFCMAVYDKSMRLLGVFPLVHGVRVDSLIKNPSSPSRGTSPLLHSHTCVISMISRSFTLSAPCAELCRILFLLSSCMESTSHFDTYEERNKCLDSC